MDAARSRDDASDERRDLRDRCARFGEDVRERWKISSGAPFAAN